MQPEDVITTVTDTDSNKLDTLMEMKAPIDKRAPYARTTKTLLDGHDRISSFKRQLARTKVVDSLLGPPPRPSPSRKEVDFEVYCTNHVGEYVKVSKFVPPTPEEAGLSEDEQRRLKQTLKYQDMLTRRCLHPRLISYEVIQTEDEKERKIQVVRCWTCSQSVKYVPKSAVDVGKGVTLSVIPPNSKGKNL